MKLRFPAAALMLSLLALAVGCTDPQPTRNVIVAGGQALTPQSLPTNLPLTVEPTTAPTPAPSQTPTPQPQPTPPFTAAPTETLVTPTPTLVPPTPTTVLTVAPPTIAPTPTVMPSPVPTATIQPTALPTQVPTPTAAPTAIPTSVPTPTAIPTAVPAPMPTPTIIPTATPTAVPTPTPAPTATPTATPVPAGADLIIECVFFDGLVKSTEADEYVQVLNQASSTVDLNGWRLIDQSDGTPEFTFPSHTLQPQASVRVYTNEVHPEYGGFSFQRGSSIWNNSNPDTAALINPNGQTVSTYIYPPSC